MDTDRERAILSIVQVVMENYALGEVPPVKYREAAASADLDPLWFGISLMPQRCRQGLLPILNPEGI